MMGHKLRASQVAPESDVDSDDDEEVSPQVDQGQDQASKRRRTGGYRDADDDGQAKMVKKKLETELLRQQGKLLLNTLDEEGNIQKLGMLNQQFKSATKAKTADLEWMERHLSMREAGKIPVFARRPYIEAWVKRPGIPGGIADARAINDYCLSQGWTWRRPVGQEKLRKDSELDIACSECKCSMPMKLKDLQQGDGAGARNMAFHCYGAKLEEPLLEAWKFLVTHSNEDFMGVLSVRANRVYTEYFNGQRHVAYPLIYKPQEASHPVLSLGRPVLLSDDDRRVEATDEDGYQIVGYYLKEAIFASENVVQGVEKQSMEVFEESMRTNALEHAMPTLPYQDNVARQIAAVASEIAAGEEIGARVNLGHPVEQPAPSGDEPLAPPLYPMLDATAPPVKSMRMMSHGGLIATGAGKTRILAEILYALEAMIKPGSDRLMRILVLTKNDTLGEKITEELARFMEVHADVTVNADVFTFKSIESAAEKLLCAKRGLLYDGPNQAPKRAPGDILNLGAEGYDAVLIDEAHMKSRPSKGTPLNLLYLSLALFVKPVGMRNGTLAGTAVYMQTGSTDMPTLGMFATVFTEATLRTSVKPPEGTVVCKYHIQARYNPLSHEENRNYRKILLLQQGLQPGTSTLKMCLNRGPDEFFAQFSANKVLYVDEIWCRAQGESREHWKMPQNRHVPARLTQRLYTSLQYRLAKEAHRQWVHAQDERQSLAFETPTALWEWLSIRAQLAIDAPSEVDAADLERQSLLLGKLTSGNARVLTPLLNKMDGVALERVTNHGRLLTRENVRCESGVLEDPYTITGASPQSNIGRTVVSYQLPSKGEMGRVTRNNPASRATPIPDILATSVAGAGHDGDRNTGIFQGSNQGAPAPAGDLKVSDKDDDDDEYVDYQKHPAKFIEQWYGRNTRTGLCNIRYSAPPLKRTFGNADRPPPDQDEASTNFLIVNLAALGYEIDDGFLDDLSAISFTSAEAAFGWWIEAHVLLDDFVEQKPLLMTLDEEDEVLWADHVTQYLSQISGYDLKSHPDRTVPAPPELYLDPGSLGCVIRGVDSTLEHDAQTFPCPIEAADLAPTATDLYDNLWFSLVTALQEAMPKTIPDVSEFAVQEVPTGPDAATLRCFPLLVRRSVEREMDQMKSDDSVVEGSDEGFGARRPEWTRRCWAEYQRLLLVEYLGEIASTQGYLAARLDNVDNINARHSDTYVDATLNPKHLGAAVQVVNEAMQLEVSGQARLYPQRFAFVLLHPQDREAAKQHFRWLNFAKLGEFARRFFRVLAQNFLTLTPVLVSTYNPLMPHRDLRRFEMEEYWRVAPGAWGLPVDPTPATPDQFKKVLHASWLLNLVLSGTYHKTLLQPSKSTEQEDGLKKTSLVSCRQGDGALPGVVYRGPPRSILLGNDSMNWGVIRRMEKATNLFGMWALMTTVARTVPTFWPPSALDDDAEVAPVTLTQAVYLWCTAAYKSDAIGPLGPAGLACREAMLAIDPGLLRHIDIEAFTDLIFTPYVQSSPRARQLLPKNQGISPAVWALMREEEEGRAGAGASRTREDSAELPVLTQVLEGWDAYDVPQQFRRPLLDLLAGIDAQLFDIGMWLDDANPDDATNPDALPEHSSLLYVTTEAKGRLTVELMLLTNANLTLSKVDLPEAGHAHVLARREELCYPAIIIVTGSDIWAEQIFPPGHPVRAATMPRTKDTVRVYMDATSRYQAVDQADDRTGPYQIVMEGGPTRPPLGFRGETTRASPSPRQRGSFEDGTIGGRRWKTYLRWARAGQRRRWPSNPCQRFGRLRCSGSRPQLGCCRRSLPARNSWSVSTLISCFAPR